MKDFVKRTLKNGLKVYFYKDKNMKRTVVSYNVKYGTSGYFDQFYFRDKLYHMQPGMAHFLEHTLIETAKRGNMLHIFKDKNYEFNGLTYKDLTSYYFIGIKDIEDSLKELIEMVDDPKFDEDAIEGVKSAIVDEARKNDDAKYALSYNINKRNVFKGFEAYPENGNQIGSKETTLAITCDDVKVCYGAYYNVDNKFLVIAGNINIDEYVKLLNEIFENFESHKNEMRIADYEKTLEVRKAYDEITKPIDSEHLVVTYNLGESSFSPLIVDLAFFIFLRMKFSNDTAFVNKLIEDKIIIGGIGWNTDYFAGNTLITFGVDILNKDEFLARLDREIRDTLIDERKFKLLKRNLIANELSKLDYIYKSIKRFPVDIYYSEKLFALDELENCTKTSMEAILNSVSFDNRSVLLIKKEAN